MSIESKLTRELEIRFIDARSIATEAKLNLGVDGYASLPDQIDAIQQEAMRIFNQEKTERERMSMRILNSRLNTIKSASSHSGGSIDNNDAEDKASSIGRRSSTCSDVSSSSRTSTGSRKLRMSWPIRRR